MDLYGPGRDVELEGDHFVRPAGDHLPENIVFTAGEGRDALLRTPPFGVGRGLVRGLGDGPFNAVQQDGFVERLLDEVDGPGLHGPNGQRHIAVTGDKYYRELNFP